MNQNNIKPIEYYDESGKFFIAELYVYARGRKLKVDPGQPDSVGRRNKRGRILREKFMKIIIVGGGKTGTVLAESLTDEGHDVTVIDFDTNRITEICNNNDVLGIVGNGINYNALLNAGLPEADLLIAVTGSDEQNLLCCLFAKKAEKCDTIARVRNPIYFNEVNFIKEQIGVSMIINPELAAATEISRLLRFPSAIEINAFSKGRVEMLTFKIAKGSVLEGKNLTYVRSKIEKDILFCCIERKGEFYIPDGSFELMAGDKASVMISPKRSVRFFKSIGTDTHSVRDVMILGGGTLSYYLAKQLIDTGISVKIIELNEQRCKTLSERLPGALVIHGDASDKNLLLEEGLMNTGAFAALTGFDEENILLSLYAKEVTNAKVITKVNRISFDDLISNLNLDSVIYPCDITAEYILQHVRAKQNAMGNNVENLYKLVEDKVEALEFKIGENAPIIGIPLQDMNLKENLVICGISRRDKFILPSGETTVQAGDSVIVVTSQKKLNDVGDILK